MITQEEKEKREAVNKEETITRLEEEIQLGLSGERLSTNQDWLKLTGELKRELDSLETRKIETYDLTIGAAFTTDQKMTALDVLKTYKQTISDLRFYVELPDRKARRGREAQEELSKLKGGI